MTTIQKYLKTEKEKIVLNAFKNCLEDFKKRGVGYYKYKNLEFVLSLTTDLKKLYFSVYYNFENKLIAILKPSDDLIVKYKEEFF